MSRSIRALVLIAGFAAAASLGGCVSLLPKAKPAQLYSFVEPPAAAPPRSGPAPAVVLGALAFPRAATSDALLTRTGTEVAYIGEARWAAPAAVLFREAVDRTFDNSGKVRVLGRGEIGQAAGILRIEVRAFETRYAVKDAIPTVAVLAHATLTRVDGGFIAERDFAAETPAADNRVGPIVDAYRASTGKTLGELATWLEANAPAQRAAAAAPAVRVTSSTSSTTSTTTVRP